MPVDHSCPVERALDILGGKWRVVILARLKEQSCRYSDLRRLVPGLSQKMLTQRLRELVAEGLVDQRDGVYALSPRGESIRPVLQSLYEWGERAGDPRAVESREQAPRS
jgi:DNA-binding HxlR family transcriptional regulator